MFAVIAAYSQRRTGCERRRNIIYTCFLCVAVCFNLPIFLESLINACQVYSPFELDCKRPASLGLFDIPNISIIDWESLDYSVWATCRSLLLLPSEVIEASMKIPFSKEKHVSHAGSIYCGKHCDMKSLSEKESRRPGDAEVDRISSNSNQGLPFPASPLGAANIEFS